MAEIVYRAQLSHHGERAVSSVLLTFAENSMYTFGRGRPPFYLDDPKISSEHFVLLRTETGLVLEDRGSTNGTKVNGMRLESRTACPVKTGDLIGFGDSSLRLGNHFVPDRDGEMLGYDVDGLTFDQVIGRGPLSVVYRGRLTKWDEPVAIKTLRGEHLLRTDRTAKRFLRAARLGLTLRHPNIVAIYRSGRVDELGLIYLVMEYIKGDALDEIVKVRGALEAGEALDLLRPIGEALAYAHAKKILHRDVNPTNILIDEQLEWAKLVGLGLAKSLSADAARLTKSLIGMGRVGFVSAEQMHDAATVDERADVFGFAATLYYALTGRTPLGPEIKSASTYLERLDEGYVVPDVRELAPDVPDRVAGALARALVLDPDKRYPRMRPMLADIAKRKTTRLLRDRFQGMMGSGSEVRAPTCNADLEVLLAPLGDVGGDFYDLIDLEGERTLILLGDVMGHGPEAAIVVGLLLGTANALAKTSSITEPIELIQAIHEQTRERLGGVFAALFVGLLDRQVPSLRFCTGGQPPLLLYNPARPEPLTYHAPPAQVVGISFLERLRVKQSELKLLAGDLVVLCTDGVLEANNADGEEFGEERLSAVLERYDPQAPLGDFVAMVDDELRAWRDREQQDDDITLIALRLK